jgi:PD-(D/E)XK endonuclease
MARGYKVAFPYGEDWDFDLVVSRHRALERVQVKYAESDRHVLVVRCRSYSLTNGKVRATKRHTADIIDWLAVYGSATDHCYYIPAAELEAGRNVMHPSVGADSERPTAWRPSGPRLHADLMTFSSARTIWKSGAIAQLEERLVCIQKVAGSSPAGSIA